MNPTFKRTGPCFSSLFFNLRTYLTDIYGTANSYKHTHFQRKVRWAGWKSPRAQVSQTSFDWFHSQTRECSVSNHILKSLFWGILHCCLKLANKVQSCYGMIFGSLFFQFNARHMRAMQHLHSCSHFLSLASDPCSKFTLCFKITCRYEHIQRIDLLTAKSPVWSSG